MNRGEVENPTEEYSDASCYQNVVDKTSEAFCSEATTECKSVVTICSVIGLLLVALILWKLWKRKQNKKKQQEDLEKRKLEMKKQEADSEENVIKGYQQKMRNNFFSHMFGGSGNKEGK
ncbi:uncharacterized protein L201_004181 [Kwoniella dendrophila CBS 6074]|uniref:PIR Superfamily Protein n=1 Tax=Kwoniella dendrophila CBS 6074 TaxID=1295534 RepID=A0AAX4JUZ5_9TREE